MRFRFRFWFWFLLNKIFKFLFTYNSCGNRRQSKFSFFCFRCIYCNRSYSVSAYSFVWSLKWIDHFVGTSWQKYYAFFYTIRLDTIAAMKTQKKILFFALLRSTLHWLHISQCVPLIRHANIFSTIYISIDAFYS